MAQAKQYRIASGYSVLDELSDVQVEMLVFLARRCSCPPRGAVPGTISALAWRGLIRRVPEDGQKWNATQRGQEAVEALPNLSRTVSDTYSVRAPSPHQVALPPAR